MPSITLQQIDPLSAAADAVGQVNANRRTQELQNQVIQRQQQRDARADSDSDRNYALAQAARTDAHAQSVAEVQGEYQRQAIAKANEDYNEKMRPLQLEHEALQIKLDKVGVLTAGERLKLEQYNVAEAKVRAAIAQKYGVPMAAIQYQQAQDSDAATRASTAATNQRAGEEAQLFPSQLSRSQSDATTAGITAATARRTFDATKDDYPVDPRLDQDYRAALTSFNTRTNAFEKTHAAWVKAGGKNSGLPEPAAPTEPVSPEDFNATILDSIDDIKTNPDHFLPMLAAINHNPGLSPYQKREATLRLQAVYKTLPAAVPAGFGQPKPSTPYGMDLGGNNGAGGFGLPQVPAKPPGT
jgi:hypothetical protein